MTTKASSFLAVNGRFVPRPVTGVERAAANMVEALSDVLRSRTPGAELRFVMPRTDVAQVGAGRLGTVQSGLTKGQFWEQFELPFRVGDEWLYNPCNLAPILCKKSIITIHDAQVYLHPEAYSPLFAAWYRLMLPVLARRARIVTTVSRHSLATLEQVGVIPKGKGHVIYNGADHIHRIVSDPSVVERLGLKPGGYFLAVGSRSPHKNLAMLNQIAGLQPDESLPIVIAGGAHRSLAATSIAESDGLVYAGRVSDQELKGLYSNALCLLFPSFSEGFGLPPLEAMGCGCPVIASNAAAIPEVCGDAALYASPHDPAEWMRQMQRIARDPQLRDALALAGQQRARNFTWKRAAESLIAIIEREDDRRVGSSPLYAVDHADPV